jgi:hypothetical protein
MSESIGSKPNFEPASNCKYAGQCQFLGECFEASVIWNEIQYERQVPGSSGLAYQVGNSTCNHEQARKARKMAKPYLSSGQRE